MYHPSRSWELGISVQKCFTDGLIEATPWFARGVGLVRQVQVFSMNFELPNGVKTKSEERKLRSSQLLSCLLGRLTTREPTGVAGPRVDGQRTGTGAPSFAGAVE